MRAAMSDAENRDRKSRLVKLGFMCNPSGSFHSVYLSRNWFFWPSGGSKYTPVCPQSSPPSTRHSPRRSHRLPSALFRVLKARRPGIQNQLFQRPLHSWRISESFSWVPVQNAFKFSPLLPPPQSRACGTARGIQNVGSPFGAGLKPPPSPIRTEKSRLGDCPRCY